MDTLDFLFVLMLKCDGGFVIVLCLVCCLVAWLLGLLFVWLEMLNVQRYCQVDRSFNKIDRIFCEFVRSFAKIDRTSKLFDRTIGKS